MKKEMYFSLELLIYYGYINLLVAVVKMYQELGLLKWPVAFFCVFNKLVRGILQGVESWGLISFSS